MPRHGIESSFAFNALTSKQICKTIQEQKNEGNIKRDDSLCLHKGVRSVEKKSVQRRHFLSHFPCLRSIHRPFKVWRRYDHYALKAYWKRTKLKDKETSQCHDKKGQRTLFVNDVKTRKKIRILLPFGCELYC